MAQIDDEDRPLIRRYSWHAKLENGEIWYAATSIRANARKLTLKMHDLIMQPEPGQMVDHRDNR